MRKHSSKTKSLISRREFAQTAALVTASAAIAPAAFSAASSDSGMLAGTFEQSAPQAPLSPEDQAEAESRTTAVLRKRGDRLSPEQKSEIHRLATELQRSLAHLRAFPLENDSQPATVLKLIPGTRTALPKTPSRKRQ